MKPTAILSLLSFAVFASVNAKSEETAVVKVDKNNFKDLINSKDPVLVEFFAPWCGHCKKLAPEFEKAASELKASNIKLAAVDCTVEASICQDHKIRGYPTLALFREGKEVTQYSGNREANAIVKFMKKQVSPAVTKLTSQKDLEKFKAEDELVIVGYFADAKPSDDFVKVAEKMRNEYNFAAMSPIDGIKEGSIFVYKNFDEGKAEFKDKLTLDALTKFIVDESIPLVGEIGPENYMKYVENGRPLAYFFYADEKQREQYAPAVQAAAKLGKGKVNTVFIDASKFGQHADVLNLEQEWPAFSIHDMEKDLKYPYPKSDKITADSLSKYMQEFIKGSLKPKFKSQPISAASKPDGNVQVVVHDNFDEVVMDKNRDVLLEIYSPGCGACKMIAPDYDLLASKVAASPVGKSMLVAKMDGTANDIPQSVKDFKLEHFPTFLLFKAKTNEMAAYDGDLTFNGLAEFLEKNAENKVTIERKAESKPEAPSAEEEEESEHDEL